MMDWISLGLVFVFGVTMGVLISSLFFESRVRFYKEFIENRLSSINRLHFQRYAKSKSSKPSYWKTILGRPSKRDDDSKSSQN
jgi:hypothetical protein